MAPTRFGIAVKVGREGQSPMGQHHLWFPAPVRVPASSRNGRPASQPDSWALVYTSPAVDTVPISPPHNVARPTRRPAEPARHIARVPARSRRFRLPWRASFLDHDRGRIGGTSPATYLPNCRKPCAVRGGDFSASAHQVPHGFRPFADGRQIRPPHSLGRGQHRAFRDSRLRAGRPLSRNWIRRPSESLPSIPMPMRSSGHCARIWGGTTRSHNISERRWRRRVTRCDGGRRPPFGS